MKIFFWTLIGIISIILLSFIGNTVGLFNITFWETKYENAKREVFEQTQSYTEAKRQSLVRYHHEWIVSEPDDKKIIESVIRQEFANIDPEVIKNPELRNFLNDVMSR